jgi:hypothetical protein
MTLAFFSTYLTSVAKEVNKWKKVAPTKPEIIGGAKPSSLMGSKPLLNGRNAPPHPPIAPQKIGPKMGKANSLAGMAAAAAPVSLHTTKARIVSYKKTTAA